MSVKKLFAAATALVIAGTISISPAKAVSVQTSVIGGTSDSLCAIISDGTIQCWGSNEVGQLGGGSNDHEDVPVSYISGTWRYMFDGAAAGHFCAIKVNGTLWCWGANGHGQLGNSSTANSMTPVQVGSAKTWVAGSVGASSTCAIKTDGTLWCWGANDYGQLGNNDSSDSHVPVVAHLTNVASVSIAELHACAIKTDGTLWCWGDGASGALGNGGTVFAAEPTQVGGSWLVVDVGARGEGDEQSCGIKSDHTLWCWGSSSDNGPVLGIGTTLTTLVPVEVDGGGSWTHVATGAWATCGVKSDASLWCWGDGYQGHLGSGDLTATDYGVPQLVTGAHTWLTSVQTHDSACGVQTDLSLWCWGAQNGGVIGVAGAPSDNPNPLALNRTLSGGLPPTDRDGGNFNGVLLLLAGALAAAGVGLSVRKDVYAK
jgi:alpha-tubulin suppressor-like RCC1 family protein